MKRYDVIIVGGGPAGLQCAHVLAGSPLSVLLIEKDSTFGDKVCAGGLTRKDLALLDIPDHLIEHKITRTAVYARHRQSGADAPSPFIFTVNRKTLGTWQRERLKDSGIHFLIGTEVKKIEDQTVVTGEGEQIGFDYLVGADGYKSVVRKHLGLPTERVLIGIQYTIPVEELDPKLEIHMHAGHFKAWYAWNFPHEGSIAVGAVCDPRHLPARQLKENFHQWLKEQGISIERGKYESAPIPYDFRGYQFGNVFLAGDAGGFASGLTGEGIYQSLVSGETAGHLILDPDHDLSRMQAIIKYNRIQERIMNIFLHSGHLRGPLQGLIITLLNNPRVKSRINNAFS